MRKLDITHQPAEQIIESETFPQTVAKITAVVPQPVGQIYEDIVIFYSERLEGTIPTIEEIEARLN